jgi:hypothetical protein
MAGFITLNIENFAHAAVHSETACFVHIPLLKGEVNLIAMEPPAFMQLVK